MRQQRLRSGVRPTKDVRAARVQLRDPERWLRRHHQLRHLPRGAAMRRWLRGNARGLRLPGLLPEDVRGARVSMRRRERRLQRHAAMRRVPTRPDLRRRRSSQRVRHLSQKARRKQGDEFKYHGVGNCIAEFVRVDVSSSRGALAPSLSRAPSRCLPNVLYGCTADVVPRGFVRHPG